jgi:hypothetical protein
LEGLEELEELDLSERELGDEGAEALAAGEQLSRLRGLDLSYCRIGDRGLGALAAGDTSRWVRLDLRGNAFGVGGLEALAAADLGALEELHLSVGSYELTREDGLALVGALSRAGWLGGVKAASFNLWNMGDEGLIRLLDAGLGPALERVALRDNALGDEGILALLERAPRLATLDLVGRAHRRHAHPNRPSDEVALRVVGLRGIV